MSGSIAVESADRSMHPRCQLTEEGSDGVEDAQRSRGTSSCVGPSDIEVLQFVTHKESGVVSEPFLKTFVSQVRWMS